MDRAALGSCRIKIFVMVVSIVLEHGISVLWRSDMFVFANVQCLMCICGSEGSTEVVRLAVQTNARALSYADPLLRRDRYFVLKVRECL